MSKKAIVFIDYNETFDDIGERYGATSNVFVSGVRQFCKHFDDQVEFAVITAASYLDPRLSIRSDLSFTLTSMPGDIRAHFRYLVEDSCQHLSKISLDRDYINYTNYQIISHLKGGKKEGVENTLKAIDSKHQIDTCVFVGDSEDLDLPMMNAEVGDRSKYFILANKRVLKSETYPVYRLSPQRQEESFSYGRDIIDTVSPQENEPLIIKSTSKSFGVGKGFQALTSYLKEREL